MRWVLAVVLGLIEGGMLVLSVPLVWVMKGADAWLGLFSVVVTVLVAVAGLRYSRGNKGRAVFGLAALVVPALMALGLFVLSQTQWD